MTAYHHGFTRRKARFLADFVGGGVRARSRRPLEAGDVLYLWGDLPAPSDVGEGVSIVRVEDGFLRSAGLGVTFAPPLSWTFDAQGLHHWGHQPTDLERLILDCAADAHLLERAARLRQRLVGLRVTKYNLQETPLALKPRREGQARVLVIGQVADDAALRGIRTPVKTNLDLLAAARKMRPDAELIYRPHPDVVAGVREGRDAGWQTLADQRVTAGGLVPLLDLVDEVHVMNSLAGFEAVLRDVPVVCHAQPFYAGWGLTTDCHPPQRRTSASLDQLVAGALILYPRYRHPETGDAIEPEDAVALLARMRDARRGAGPWADLREALLARVARIADAWRARRAQRARSRHA